MTSMYLYMQLPDSLDITTLGRLRIVDGVGEFVYSPEYVEAKGWVPDPTSIDTVQPDPQCFSQINGRIH